MMRRLAALFVALSVGTACDGLPEPEPDEPAPDGPDDPVKPEPLGDDFDFTRADWELSNVSLSEGTISHDGQLAFIEHITVAVFSEPRPEDFGDQDIHRSNRAGNAWSPVTMTREATTQLAFPAIAATNDSLWFSWTGRPADEGDLGIWLRREVLGGVATESVNLTAATGQRQNTESQLVAKDDGVTVVYLSYAGVPGGPRSDHDMRAIRISGENTSTAPQVIFQPETGQCADLRAVGDASGNVHAIVTCFGGDASLVYITNAGGSWESTAVPMFSRSPTIVDIAVDSAGSVHLVWAGTTDCGEEACRRVFYSRDFGAEVTVGDEPGFMPVIGVDPHGRPVVAFHRTGDSHSMMVSHSDDGRVFSTPRALPNGGDRDTSATQLVFDENGRPHLLFERVYTGTSPLNAEVMHATID